MNPYDFVPIDWHIPPERHCPSPHDRFDGVSGKIEGTITAETPLFIFRSPKKNSGAEPFISNALNQHIIPGSSLKGLFRNLVETIGNGCFLVFDEDYEYDKERKKYTVKYGNKLLSKFKKCSTADLCIACRMFGTIQGSILGKISFNDAEEVNICDHRTVYTIALMEPKPRHQAFYLEPNRQHIAGRKFYFHQPSGIQAENQKTKYNQYIKPIDKGSLFSFSVQFTNLEDAELQTLLYALVLEPEMRHKIGYGKPAGLGSVRFEITKLKMIDYACRYRANQGITEYVGNELASYLATELQPFKDNTTSLTLNALRRIWRWDSDDTTTYRYPVQSWFSANPAAPISKSP